MAAAPQYLVANFGSQFPSYFRGGSLKKMESWRWSKDKKHSICCYWLMDGLIFVWWMLRGKREQLSFPLWDFMPFIWVFVRHQHCHKLLSVGVAVCHLVGNHAHVMLEKNVLVRWWCEWLPCFYESSMMPFADLAAADRRKYTQTCVYFTLFESLHQERLLYKNTPVCWH